MFRTLVIFILLAHLGGCSSPNRLVYSSGFTFADYDYIIINKPDSPATSTSLYGMDVEIANLLAKYNMNVIGDKEFLISSTDNKKRTLIARMAISASDKRIVMTVSFDDAVTGRTRSSVTSGAKGDIFDGSDRNEALEAVSKLLVDALRTDKGLKIK
jgi:hypothetical protein